MTTKGDPSPRVMLLAAVVAFVAVTVLFLSPLVLSLGSRMVVPSFGGPAIVNQARDRYHFLWNFWWLRGSVLGGHLGLETNLIFAPQGVSLALQTIDYVDGFITLPLAPVLGGVGAYNFVVLASFVLTGATTFMLAKHLTGSWPASVVAGLVFTFFPQRLSQVLFGHPNLFSVEWLPAFFLALMLAFESKSLKYAALTGVLGALLTYTDLEQLVMGVMGASVYLIYYLAAERASVRRDLVRLVSVVGVAAAVWFLASSPYLVPAYQAVATQARPPPALSQVFSGSAHPLLYVVPSPENAFFGPAFAPLYAGLSGGASNFILFVGYAVIALAVLGVVTSPDRRKYFLISMAAVFLVFSLGPSPTPGTPSLQTPYTILYNASSFLRYFRSPARYSIPMMLALAGLAAMGFQSLERRLASRPGNFRRYALTAAVIALIMFEFAPQAQTQQVPVSPGLRVLSSAPGSFSVLELPTNITMTQFYLYQQTIFERPLVNGKVSQVPQTLPQFAFVQPFLRELVNPVNSARNPRDIINQTFTDSELGPIVLTEYGIKFVVLNVASFRTPKIYQLVYATLSAALGSPVYADASVVIFSLESWVSTPAILQLAGNGTLALFGSGWGPLSAGSRVAADGATISVFTATPGLYRLVVSSSVPLCVTPTNSSGSSDCGSAGPAPGEQQFLVPLQSGKNVLVLSAAAPADVSYVGFVPAL